jgi:CRISPR-associated endonuclease/helicase Cas3
LIPWIRGWGANIEVLEPQILRDRWLSDARDLIKRHGGS